MAEHFEFASCMFIWVPLDPATCAITTGVPSFVTTGVLEMEIAPETEDGTDYSSKNAGGSYCGPQLKGPKITKWGNVTGTFCMKNYPLLAALTGNPTSVDDDDNVVGYGERITEPASPCSPATIPKVALLVISRAAAAEGLCSPAVAADGFSPCLAHVYPLFTEFATDNVRHADERRNIPFTATAYSNPNIGRGPFNLYPTDLTPTAIPPNVYHHEFFRPCAGLPTPSPDAILHPTVVAPA